MYASKLSTIKEMFPDWTDEDIVFALQETDGNLEGTIDRMSEAQDKPVVDPAPTGDWSSGGTADGVIGTWNQTPDADGAALDSSWENINASEASTTPAAEPKKPGLKPDGTRSWASMFNKPAPPPVTKKPSKEVTPEALPEEPAALSPKAEELDMPALPPPIQIEAINPDIPNTPPSPSMISSEPAAELTPPRDRLTETNLEQVLDTSGPTNSATAASTVASTLDQRTGTGTPLQPPAQPSTTRPPMGGYATTAYKATGIPGRSASFQRKIIEQREAVVMPGKHAVDRAAVQFGSMGLNGTNEDLDADDDREEPETRAQPPQHSPIAPKATLPPPGQSPQQMTSESLPTPRQAPGLPPPIQQPSQQPTPAAAGEQGLPQQSSQPYPPFSQFGGRFGPQQTPPEASAPIQKPYEPFGSQIQQPHHSFDNYPSTSQGPTPTQHQASSHLGGLSSAPQDMSSYYTSDSQRQAYQHYYATYGQQSQQNPQEQNRTSSAFGTSGVDQSSQHAPSHPQQQPLGRYAQPSDAQTSGSSTPNPSLPGQGQPGQPNQGPHMLHQQQQPPGQTGGQHGAYPYGQPYYPGNYYQPYMNQVSNHAYGRERPMFDDVRRYDDQFLTQPPQFGYGGSQGGYGGPFGGGAGKQGLYGQPHQGYGMSPQTPYDQHTSSPANPSGFGQQQQQQQHSAPGREGAASANMSNYNRAGSAQPSEHQQQYAGGASSGYGAGSDAFGRSTSGFQGQTSHGLGHQQQAGQHGGSEDALRGFGESKMPGGPSPAPGARPGSAINNLPGQGGLPSSQSQGQQSYGGYPGHLNHQMHGQQGSQYGAGPGGLGGHQQSAGQGHQGTGYGGYGAGFGGSYYGSNRGGWGGNYGH
ncbi:MAG: hypothetical protein LQ346_007329 [Caloplaca aetnensis]|nr:MAG: hypothetical protein LQ346_007329 [Caloplaca aetnensis]